MLTRNITRFIFAISVFALMFGAEANATEVSIGNGETRATSGTNSINSGDSVLFIGTSTGILEHNRPQDVTLGSISTDNAGVGNVNIDTANYLTVNGDIGAINNINFVRDGTLIANGNVFAKTITTDTSEMGSLTLLNNNNSVVSSNIGSDALNLSSIALDNSKTNFTGEIHTLGFSVNKTTGPSTATISGANSDLGNITMIGDNGVLNLNQNVAANSINNVATSKINFAVGKKLAINNDGNAPVSTIAGDLGFDYSNASPQKLYSKYAFLTFSGVAGALTYDPSISTTNSINAPFLLTPTVAKIGDNLVVTQTLNSTNFSTITSNKSFANFLIFGTAGNSDNGGAQTALVNFKTQGEVEDALTNLATTSAIDSSNMLQKTSVDVSSAVGKLINNRLQALSYNKFAANLEVQAQKNNDPKSNPKTDPKTNADALKISGLRGEVWGEVFGAKSTQGDISKEGSATKTKGYDADFAGVSFGLDKTFSREKIASIFGGAVSYGTASAKGDAFNKQKTDIKLYQLSLYNYNGLKNGLGFFNENIIGLGYNQYDSSKIVSVGNNYQSLSSAKFSGREYDAKVGIGYNLKVGEKVIFAPIAAIKYFGLQLADYQERNAGGLGQNVKNNRFDLFTSEVGFRLMGEASSTIKPQANILWLHNLNTSGARSQSVLGSGGNAINTSNKSVNLDQDILNLGTQLSFQTSPETAIVVKYDLQKSANFVSHLGAVKFNFVF